MKRNTFQTLYIRRYILIRVNLFKKLTKMSVLFMVFSLIFIWFIGIYNANLKITGYELIINYNSSIKDFLSETSEIVVLVGVLFAIILSLLEIDNQVASFDAFYIVHFGRMNYHNSKLIAYSIIISTYITYLFLGIALIYLYRFKNIYYLNLIFKMYFDTIIYILYFFLIGYNLVLISKNHFSVMIIILIYWFSKIFINNQFDKYSKYFLLRLNFDYENFKFGFEINYLYVIINVIVHLFVNYFIYAKKDIKC